MTADELRRLYGFHRWATLRLLAAAESLSSQNLLRAPEDGSPSARDALVRLLWSDWVWLRRFFGLSPRIVFDPDDFPDVAALRDKWAEVYDEMSDLLGPLTDAGAGRRIAYRDVRGNGAEGPLGLLLLHQILGAAHQRGLVAGWLRSLGCAVPAGDDLLTYLGEAGPADGSGA